jgi:purine-binding chemotaxis protein CheW
MAVEQRQDSALDLLVFELAGVRFGLELGSVREVVRAVLVTPLPGAPPVVEGIIDVRGSIVAVYDLRARFGLVPKPLHPDEQLVIAWTGEQLAAVRCERAEWIERADAAAIESGAPVDRGGSRILGVARLSHGLVLIHDLQTFLDDAERADLDDALAAHEARGNG